MTHILLERTRTLGIAFLALMLFAVWLTYAIFTKKFSEYDEVTLETSSIGLQLPRRADVKVNGMIVGEVREMKAVEGGAELTLGLYPEHTEHVPSNVTGRIVPKTLFGEKYVSLVYPDRPAEAIRAGARIERTEVATEVEQVLSDLYPLLRAVRPADINYTLNALATALEGRGEKLGETLVTLDGYLTKFNPEIPALVEDLRLAGDTADLYSDILPEVSAILQDTMVTTGTLETREDKLNALFTEVGAMSQTTQGFLETNEENLIRIGPVNEPILSLLARYSSEFPCLTGGIAEAGRRNAETFRDYTLHIVLELLPHQPRAYTEADAPRYGEHRGPQCLSLPVPPWSQDNPMPLPEIDDGVDEPLGKDEGGPLPAHRVAPGRHGSGLGEPTYVGSAAEESVLKSLLAPGLGVPPEQVEDLGVLLLGPMARGATVGLAEVARDESQDGGAR